MYKETLSLMSHLIAAGKTTFLESLRKFYPEAVLISEPINKWQNIPAEKEVMETSITTIVTSSFPIQDGTIITDPQQGSNLLDLFYKDPKRWAYTFQVIHTLAYF